MRLVRMGKMDGLSSVILMDALEIARSKGIVGNTMTLCCPSASIWIGEKQNLSHVDTLFCREKGIPVIRRVTEGGAIVHGGQVTVDLFSDSLPTLPILVSGIIKAFRIIGLHAVHRPHSNDVLVNERKICGVIARTKGGILHFSANLSLDFDSELAERALRIPAEKFKDKNAKTVGEWVTSTSRELGREVSYEEAEDALVKSFSSVLGVQFEEAELTSEELSIMDELADKYESESWIKYGKWSPVKDYWRPK